MKKDPLFTYSLNFKVFTFVGVILFLAIVLIGIAIRFDITDVSIYWVIYSFLFIFGINLTLFLIFVTFPLENISKQILALLTGKRFTKIPPIRNDEIGVITHFFNTVTERVKDLSGDIAKGKRMSSELRDAADIQADVFPKSIPDDILGLDIIAKSRSSSEVGGDCFDFIKSGEDTLIYIGDVTGHGVPASLIMMIVSTQIETLASQNIPPKDIIIKTNKTLKKKISSNHFMSLLMLRWQNRKQKMSYIGAGHEYILHYSLMNKTVSAIKAGGIALKMVPDVSKIVKEEEIDFREGDAVLIYTDGIIEARNKESKMYGVERLRSIFLQNAYRKAPDIFDKITEDFSTFLGENHKQEDDITMIVIKNIGQHSRDSHINFSINTDERDEIVSSKVWSWE